MRSVHFKLDDELHRQLKAECALLNITIKSFVLTAAMQELKKRRDIRLDNEKKIEEN